MFKRNYILPEDYISASEFSKQVQAMKSQPEYNPLYKLEVPEGTYSEDTLFRLFWTVFKHRLSHFLQGEGFRD